MKHTHISAKHNLLDLKLKEVGQYKDLIGLFTRRSFKVSYKQTILGPLWLILVPLLTTLLYVILFGNIAKLSTEGVPHILFYLIGSSIWAMFASCVNDNAHTFTNNSHLFGKIYFPRLVVPISNVIVSIVKFLIQFALFVIIYIVFFILGDVSPNWWMLLAVPLIVVEMSILGMGLGIIISSLTTKYRDLSILVSFGLQLFMYASPIVYPLSATSGWFHTFLIINPVTGPIELLRNALFNTGSIELIPILSSVIWTVVVAFVGIIIFNKVERTFMDTI